MQQKIDYALKNETGNFRISSSKTVTYPIVPPKKELNVFLMAKTDSLVENILSYPRVWLPHLHVFLMDGVEIKTSLSDFA